MLVAIAIYIERATLLPSLVAVGGACLAFNLVSMLSGYGAPLALRLPRSQAVAIAMDRHPQCRAGDLHRAQRLEEPGRRHGPGHLQPGHVCDGFGLALWLLRRRPAAQPA